MSSAASEGSAKLYADTAKLREAIAAKLTATRVRALERTADLIRNCGAYACGIRVKAGNVIVCHRRCKATRFCAACHGVLAAEIRARLTAIVGAEFAAGSALKFVTLTIRHSRADRLRTLRKLLVRAWGLLIRRKFWKGLAFAWHRATEIEFTLNAGWHPHFHLVLKIDPASDAYHWSRARLENELREVWQKITGGLKHPSYVIRVKDVETAQEAEDVVKELVKYITKRCGRKSEDGGKALLDYSREELIEYAAASKNWHLQQPGGAWKPENLEDDPERLEPGSEDFIGWQRVEFELAMALSGVLDAAKAAEWLSVFPQLVPRLLKAGCAVQAERVTELTPMVLPALRRLAGIAVKT